MTPACVVKFPHPFFIDDKDFMEKHYSIVNDSREKIKKLIHETLEAKVNSIEEEIYQLCLKDNDFVGLLIKHDLKYEQVMSKAMALEEEKLKTKFEKVNRIERKILNGRHRKLEDKKNRF